MGIALFTIRSLCNTVGDWLNPPHVTLYHPATRGTGTTLRTRSRMTPQSWLHQNQHGMNTTPKHNSSEMNVTPLRVLRLSEAGAPHSAGRMRISGRMADVCAELDRLVAKEAQNLAH